MPDIKQLSENGTQFYPETHIEAVLGLDEELNEISVPLNLNQSITLGGTTGVTINLTPNAENGWNCGVCDCAEGDVFYVNGHGGSSTRLWGFVNSSNVLLSVSAAGEDGLGERIVAPQNASKFVTNNNDAKTCIYIKKDSVQYRLDYINHSLIQINGGTFDEFWHNRGYYSVSGSNKKQFTDTADIRNISLDVTPSMAFVRLSGFTYTPSSQGPSTYTRILFFDENDNALASVTSFTDQNNTEMVLEKPAGATQCYVDLTTSHYNEVIVTINDISNIIRRLTALGG